MSKRDGCKRVLCVWPHCDCIEPCPFCGGEPTVAFEPENNGHSAVYCFNGDCEFQPGSMSHETEAESIAAWNRRSPSRKAVRMQELALGLVQALNTHSVGAVLNGQAYTDVVGAKNLLASALAEEE